MWRSEDNFYGVVGLGIKLGPLGFPTFLTTEPSHFFQILSFFFLKMFVVCIYLCKCKWVRMHMCMHEAARGHLSTLFCEIVSH